MRRCDPMSTLGIRPQVLTPSRMTRYPSGQRTSVARVCVVSCGYAMYAAACRASRNSAYVSELAAALPEPLRLAASSGVCVITKDCHILLNRRTCMIRECSAGECARLDTSSDHSFSSSCHAHPPLSCLPLSLHTSPCNGEP